MADWPLPCAACHHAAHRGGECPQCDCTYVPYVLRDTPEARWLAFRYRIGSAWQVPGQEGRWLIA